MGVVDDTCDVVVQAALVVEGIRLQAQARVIVGPPHFAPDRRPFVSLADDLTDRDPAVFAEEEPLVDAQHRVNDLFQRALEVAGLFNLTPTVTAAFRPMVRIPRNFPVSHAPTAPA